MSNITCMNDLVDSCCDNVNIYLFADDAKLYAHIKSEQNDLTHAMFLAIFDNRHNHMKANAIRLAVVN